MSTISTPHPLVAELQNRMFRAGLKPNDIMRLAKVGRATWWRWSKGISPNLATLDKVSRAIEAKEGEGDE